MFKMKSETHPYLLMLFMRVERNLRPAKWKREMTGLLAWLERDQEIFYSDKHFLWM